MNHRFKSVPRFNLTNKLFSLDTVNMKFHCFSLLLIIIACVDAGVVIKLSDEFEMEKDANGHIKVVMKKPPAEKIPEPPKEDELQIHPMQTVIAVVNPFLPTVHTIFRHVVRTGCDFNRRFAIPIHFPGIDDICDESFFNPDNLRKHINPYLSYLHQVPKAVVGPIVESGAVAGIPLVNEFVESLQV